MCFFLQVDKNFETRNSCGSKHILPDTSHLTKQIWYILHFCVAVFITIREGIKTTTTLKALRWMNKNCYLYGYISNDFVSCSYLWFCSIHTSEFCDDSADRLQSSAYLFYLLPLSLLIVRQVIQKIMSSLEIKEFTGDLCWTFCCDVQLHLRKLAWPSNKIVRCYNILGHTMEVWDF